MTTTKTIGAHCPRLQIMPECIYIKPSELYTPHRLLHFIPGSRGTSMTKFDSLPGYYKFIFLYFEPISEIGPIIGSILWGPSWFYNELTPPTGPPPTNLDVRSAIAIWQLTICYFLLFVMTSLGFRAIRDTLSHNPASQERVMGTFLFSLALADVTHIFLTFINLPEEIKYTPLQWNQTTHGNITVVFLLHLSRISWFLGIGRKRYYFGQSPPKIKVT